MKLYHYSDQPLKTLLTLSHQGKTSPELDRRDEQSVKRLGFKYTDHISFFMEPIPKETIHLSFPKDHPVWSEGNTIYEHVIDILQFSKNPFSVVESPTTSAIRDRTPDWFNDKLYFTIQDIAGLTELRSGTSYLDLRKAIRKYRGVTERAFSKLRTDSYQYAPNIPHVMMECLEKVMVESVNLIPIGPIKSDLESAKELKWHPNFGPSYTPMEMLNLGIFEGIYTHAIKDIPAKYTKHKNVLGKEGPDESINQFKVKSRQSLKVWQENKWVTKDSPLGWWEWYVKYFEGRRLPEDEWQIGRWRSFVSRHMGQIVAANQTSQLDKRVKQRQGLLQWGWNSTVLVTEVTIRSNAKRMAKLVGASVGEVKTKDKI